MNRIDRLFGILTTLQSKKYITADKLAEKYDISVRTVYRDIRALTELGIPVSFEKPKGYFVVQGLTTEEANALILISSLSEKFGDNSTYKSIESALTKIKAGLKFSEKEKIETLSSNISIYIHKDGETDNDFLTQIQNSISTKTILEIEYTNNLNITTTRKIEPVGLAFYTLQWHLIAWCWKRKEYRDFKIKMISKLKDTLNPFEKKSHWTITEYLSISSKIK
jgi:predicted DNA-binding transcriptional regulator YafY